MKRTESLREAASALHQARSRNPRRMLAASAFVSSLMALSAMAATDKVTGAPDPAKTRSFVVTYFWNSISTAANDCPSGLAPGPDKEIAIARLPAEQRDEYRKSDQKIMRIISNRGPNGENVCTSPTVLPDPGFPVAQGNIEDGLDLETAGGPGPAQVCKHVELSSPNGEKGIDNQLSRVMACVQHRRADGFFPKYFVNQMRSGEYAYLIEVTGVDNDRDDAEVQVGLYASADPMVLDGSGKVLSHASLEVTSDPAYRQILRGRIDAGVLTTEPAQIKLPSGSVFPPLELRNARLRLSLLPDGKAEGVLGGYQDWHAYYKANVSTGGISEMSGGPFQCSGLYYALQKAADAYPDPATGQCTAISSAYKIEAIQAFVIHPQSNDTKTVQLAPGSSRSHD
jgi:hypothetical protein